MITSISIIRLSSHAGSLDSWYSSIRDDLRRSLLFPDSTSDAHCRPATCRGLLPHSDFPRCRRGTRKGSRSRSSTRPHVTDNTLTHARDDHWLNQHSTALTSSRLPLRRFFGELYACLRHAPVCLGLRHSERLHDTTPPHVRIYCINGPLCPGVCGQIPSRAGQSGQDFLQKEMSALPSSAAPTTTDLSTSNAASLKQLKSSMHLDFSSPTSSKKQIISADLLEIIKASPTIGKMFSQGTTTPTPTKLLYPSEVTLAQRQYAQGFIGKEISGY
uniref:Jun-like transcription factor domain-containing protein n=1 Tax=Setaria digitata TaxID=48799 RepID=A0A915PWB4_9BILA